MKMRLGRLAGAAMAAWLVLASPGGVHAQDDERARVHFQAGRAYFEEGAYERALQEFREAYELSQRHVMLWNIGTTEERLGMYSEAADSFERFLANVEEVPNRAVLERRVQNLRERVRREAEANQGEPAVTASQEPQPTGGAAPPDAEPADTGGGGGDGLLIGGVAALAVAGAAGIAFAVTGGLALAAQSEVEGGCFADRSCTPDDVAGMDTLALVSDVMWPIALAAAAAGGIMIALGATSGADDRAALRVLPFAGPNSAGIAAEGGF